MYYKQKPEDIIYNLKQVAVLGHTCTVQTADKDKTDKTEDNMKCFVDCWIKARL